MMPTRDPIIINVNDLAAAKPPVKRWRPYIERVPWCGLGVLVMRDDLQLFLLAWVLGVRYTSDEEEYS